MIQSLTEQACPECGHHSSGILAGTCTAFVPGSPGGPLAVPCACPCYDAITGRSYRADWDAAFAQGLFGGAQ